jgi:hypothetical protein
MKIKTLTLFCLAFAALGMLQACSKSYSNPCALITSEMGAGLLGTPALTREVWKLDYEAPAVGGRPVAGWSAALGYRFVHACSIEAVDPVARDQGKAATVFFVVYLDKGHANSAYETVRGDARGTDLLVRDAKAFTTSDTQTDEVLSVWIFRDRLSIDFSIGTADLAQAQLFASKLARRL